MVTGRDSGHTLKAVFKGAATTIVQHRSTPLFADYERMLAGGTKPNLAKVTLARIDVSSVPSSHVE